MDRAIARLRDSTPAVRAGLDGASVARPPAGPGDAGRDTVASRAVTSLYEGHALGLTRLAFIVLGDRHAAEDVVQEAFCGLFRAWDRLPDGSNVLGYLRASVLNGCRTALRRQKRTPRLPAVPSVPSAEAAAMVGEEQRAAVAALRRLPPRQREALVLRYYADLPEYETALAMGVSRGTVKSTTARARAALGRMLREDE